MTSSGLKHRTIRTWVFRILLITILGFLIWGISWATYARPPLPEALEALESDQVVSISSDPWLIFKPEGDHTSTGLIFYPGGRIDPRGYATLLREISSQGYLVVVPSMPINMAVFNANAADEIIEAYQDIENWVIGGHSVGGTMAAQYASQNLDLIQGLVIWASYPAGNSDISQTKLPVYSIFGDLDPQANEESVLERSELFPPGTRYIAIAGGDHHQFGSYEIKPKEHHATVPRDVQQEQLILATLELLDLISQGD